MAAKRSFDISIFFYRLQVHHYVLHAFYTLVPIKLNACDAHESHTLFFCLIYSSIYVTQILTR